MSTFMHRSAAALAGGALFAWQGAAFAAAPPESFSALARQVTPAVVNIASEREARGPATEPFNFDFPPGTPFEEFFRRFREQQRAPGRRAVAQGSGFIVDATGYIVTNNHVVADAKEVTVTLESGRKLPAKVVGIDDQTDIALLKVEAGQPLPTVQFGDSDKVEVGDWVLAVGNPFGFGGTVTAGIVSARGRNLNAGPYDDFLQVDAPINMGNSGGPLFSLDGKLIGINTAIVTPNQGSVGIGFAIPANMAQPVVQQLKDKGTVARGWLGVQIQPVTPELAEAMGLDRPTGALIAAVVAGGPAATAGLKPGDVILALDGHRIGDLRDLTRQVAATTAGATVKLELWRERARTTQQVTIAPREPERLAALPGADASDPGMSRALGAAVSPITRELRERYGIAEPVKGVVVTDLARGGAAERAGLRPGDVIQKIGDQAVSSPAQLEAALRSEPAGQRRPVLLQVSRQGSPLFMALRIG